MSSDPYACTWPIIFPQQIKSRCCKSQYYNAHPQVKQNRVLIPRSGFRNRQSFVSIQPQQKKQSRRDQIAAPKTADAQQQPNLPHPVSALFLPLRAGHRIRQQLHCIPGLQLRFCFPFPLHQFQKTHIQTFRQRLQKLNVRKANARFP